MRKSKNGRWEFDQDGNIHYISPEDIDAESTTSYHYSYTENHTSYSSNYSSNGRKKENSSWHWILIVLSFGIFPPVGLFLLVLELMGKWPDEQQLKKQLDRTASVARRARKNTVSDSRREQLRREAAETRAQYHKQQPEGAPAMNTGNQKKSERLEAKAHGFGSIRGFRIIGGLLAGIFGFAFLCELVDDIAYFFSLGYLLRQTIPLLALCLVGVTLLGVAGSRSRKMKKFRKYLKVIGRRDKISIPSLAETMGVSEKKCMDELEEMLERNYFDPGYIDAGRKLLVLTDEAFPEPEPQPEPEPRAEVQETLAESTLRHIREINDDIDNPDLSAKLDRIQELTAKIFRLLDEDPEKAADLRSFMNYYLPQTLKILENYAKLEEQDVDGDNIRETKEKIEGMMDKIVDGYEAQLDKLFADDALDISADLKVMESMLEKDGLTVDQELKL